MCSRDLYPDFFLHFVLTSLPVKIFQASSYRVISFVIKICTSIIFWPEPLWISAWLAWQLACEGAMFFIDFDYELRFGSAYEALIHEYDVDVAVVKSMQWYKSGSVGVIRIFNRMGIKLFNYFFTYYGTLYLTNLVLSSYKFINILMLMFFFQVAFNLLLLSCHFYSLLIVGRQY